MAFPLDRRLLDKMLTEGALSEDDLRSLMKLNAERSSVEFKDGAETREPPKAARKIRRYVSGFANSEGGILIVGVSDGAGGQEGRRVTGTTSPGKGNLEEWAADVLTPVAAGLSPPAAIQAMPVQEGEVLLIGVARAPILIMADGQYYLRHGHQTLKVEPYLLSDLLVGRRAHPVLTVENLPGAINGDDVHFAFRVTNDGFAPAEDIVVGVITWARQEPPVRSNGRPATAELRKYVDLRVPPMETIPGLKLAPMHVSCAQRGRIDLLPAFESTKVLTVDDILAPRGVRDVPMRSAVYVVAGGHPPNWYQFDWVLPRAEIQGQTEGKLSRCWSDRPIVEWGSEWRTKEEIAAGSQTRLRGPSANRSRDDDGDDDEEEAP
jgi:hypothetical protein